MDFVWPSQPQSLPLRTCFPPQILSLATPLQYFDLSVAPASQLLCSSQGNYSAINQQLSPRNPTTSSVIQPGKKKKHALKSTLDPVKPHMQVTSLHESATAFTACISIVLPPDSAHASGLSITSDSAALRPPLALTNGTFYPFDPANPAAECAHEVCVSIARPIPISLTLNLPWPVAAGSVIAKLLKSKGSISLVLPKATEWPQDWSVPGIVHQVCQSDITT